MPLVVPAPGYDFSFGAADSLADMSPAEQCAVICGELEKPRKPETIRRKLLIYWPIISNWHGEHPELFDTVLCVFVAEIEARHAAAPDGIRHLREIAES